MHNKKVVIITGASSGIGLACSRVFAGRGASVVLAARGIDAIEKEAEQMRSGGLDAFPFRTDVSREEDCRELINAVVERYGRIDVLINNAGISMRALFNDTDLNVLRRIMEVNFWGTVYCTKFALPYLLESRGSVAGISSVAGYQGLPGRTGYSASKFAMHGFLESLRLETKSQGLHVLIAAPGFTSSNIRKSALTGDGSEQEESPRAEEKMMTAEDTAMHIYRAIVKRRRTLVLTSEGKTTVLLKKFAPAILEKLVHGHFMEEPGSPLKNR